MTHSLKTCAKTADDDLSDILGDDSLGFVRLAINHRQTRLLSNLKEVSSC